jgi:hypothetical protein
MQWLLIQYVRLLAARLPSCCSPFGGNSNGFFFGRGIGWGGGGCAVSHSSGLANFNPLEGHTRLARGPHLSVHISKRGGGVIELTRMPLFTNTTFV